MRLRWTLGLLLALTARCADAPSAPDPDALYSAGKELFDTYAPPEVKEQYEFPSRAQWDAFAARLQKALDSNSLEDLAAYEPEARAALAAVKDIPGAEDYAAWLGLKLDEIEVAHQEVARRAAAGLRPPAASRTTVNIPLYDLWLERERRRPVPAGAQTLMPVLQRAFREQHVSPDLAWLAEAESSLNPSASSPSGATGLFQLMAPTAKALGLSTFLPDERRDPAASANASARYLRRLYETFGNWPLALAAYNAGEGRLRRAMAARGASDFAGAAPSLPSETQMYVPKVLALVDVRTGVRPEDLASPGT